MTYSFLNSYSWAKFGKGSHKWQMREYTFIKDFALGMLSNSGKTRVSNTMVWIRIYNWDGSLYKVVKNKVGLLIIQELKKLINTDKTKIIIIVVD